MPGDHGTLIWELIPYPVHVRENDNYIQRLAPYPVHVRDHDNKQEGTKSRPVSHSSPGPRQRDQGASTPQGTPSADGSHRNELS